MKNVLTRFAAGWSMSCCLVVAVRGAEPTNARRPTDDTALRYWLENMVRYHRFSHREITSATGLSGSEIDAALDRFQIKPDGPPPRPAGEPLLVLPYPGGRHPRIGFLDGAVRPQRETKFSVFLPWEKSGYVVVDLPEAVWSNLGLTYLAHTHVDTIWTKRGIELEKLEWKRGDGGRLDSRRTLPNGIAFGANVLPTPTEVRMELRLTNGTKRTLSDLRVQICAMLKGAPEFNEQINENKRLASPFAACRSKDARRWIVTAWDHCFRPWANPPCPCMHSDPKFPDCPPGRTKTVRGWLSFYEGDDVAEEFRRIKASGWLRLGN